MAESVNGRSRSRSRIYERALDARDPRFDGIFFVGITTTSIYCRPICPTRRALSDHRRFFSSAAAAERAGYRPCLRCRPELAPGRAWADAVPRLAHAAARRIAAGALNGRTVGQLAVDLGVSERHLRRAMNREIGVSPVELAQTHRLLLAKRLLADTRLTLLRVASASGFQSLRRFNAVFRERYRMSPGAVRRSLRSADGRGEPQARRSDDRSTTRAPPTEARRGHGAPDGEGTARDLGSDLLRLTLAYRPPFAWDALLTLLRRNAIPGVELVHGRRYGRTVEIDGRRGIVLVEDASSSRRHAGASRAGANHVGASRASANHATANHLNIDLSVSLLPALMPLLARLRQLFDLDAEPAAIEACLGHGGLGKLVRRRPGLRMPGAFDGFEVAWHLLLCARRRPGPTATDRARCIVGELGEPCGAGIPALTHFAPTAERIAEAGAPALASFGLPRRRAEAIAALATQVAEGRLRLEPGSDVAATRLALLSIDGVTDRLATTIVMRALSWPDAFPATDRALQRAAGVPGPGSLRALAERWRPWRAYVALHLRLADEEP